MFQFAFRNVLRNRKRTLLTASAIFVAALAVGMSMGWVNGLLGVMLDDYVKYQTGHFRIITEGYQKRERFVPVNEVFYDSEPVLEALKKIDGVALVEQRMRFGILLGNSQNTVEAFGMGLDLGNNYLNVTNQLLEGKYVSNGIIIGSGLAKKLGLKLGDPIMLATQTQYGGLNAIKLPVIGIFQLGVASYDDSVFFVPLENSRRLLQIDQGSTEIFVFAKQGAKIDKMKDEIKKTLPEGVIVQDYKEQMGNMYQFVEYGAMIFGFVEALILFLASFVIINTMMMAIFERLPEIGMLKAMGMSDRDIFINFTLEGAIIGAIGGVTGAVAGVVLTNLMAIQGIDFQEAFKQVNMPIKYILRPTAGIPELLTAMIMSIVVPAIAAMIPARYAGRLTAVEALRK